MTNPSEDEAMRQEIARRAHFRFCDRGCAHGGDVEDWLAAEREVIESRTSEAAPTPSRAKRRPSRKASR